MKGNHRVALAAAVIMALGLSGCTWWLSADFADGVHVGYTGPDWPAGGTEAPHEPAPTAEVWPESTPILETCAGVVTAQPRLNVRATPGGAVFNSVVYGAPVEITAQSGEWYEIEPSGWVSAAYVRIMGVCDL